MERMSEEDAYWFKRCVRKLLDSTFILEDRDEKLYDYLSSEANQYDMNVYLSAIGYKVVVEDRMKVAMLQQADEDVDTVGLKRINLFRFDQKEIQLLVILWLLFLERMGYTDPVYVTVGDVMDKCGIYQMAFSPGELRNAFRTLKRFSLIDYGDDLGKEDGRIRLYPSLSFCMDPGQLKLVADEYISGETDTEEEPEINE
ncbi:MAG: DUF4194 domain-containing protein [Lachnospiraceae bacterium]|nr:DUF4194 domain-containing protein [Lachnospiraceae bacterium]